MTAPQGAPREAGLARPLFVGVGNRCVRCDMCGEVYARASAAHARMHIRSGASIVPSSGPPLVVHERITAARYEYVIAPRRAALTPHPTPKNPQ